ncbi:hypothetical protein RB195_003927 [Necator americanus]|uniref:Transthyretin-like family protein n=1 Tax=Necator americanus TaxID=51031 RepID=A0ABR1DQV3_NECAM
MHLLPLILVATILLPNSFCLLGFGKKQSVAVKGTLQCNGEAESDVRVALYDKDMLKNRKLGEVKTDKSGEFNLSGSKTEISKIDPKVNIYHRCDHTGPCYRKFSFTIPDKFITRGSTPKRTFDLGTINLAAKFAGESLDCIK